MKALEIRKKLKLSQSQMAKVCNTHPMLVSKWELGHNNPSGATVRLFDALNYLHENGQFKKFIETLEV